MTQITDSMQMSDRQARDLVSTSVDRPRHSMPPQSTEREWVGRLVVERKVTVAEGIVTLILVDPAGRELPEWTAGAHVDIVLSAIDVVRQYSLCGSPSDRRHWRVGVLREVDGRGGSQFIHDEIQEGDTVQVRGPRNHFELARSPGYLFIAGGIGITPMLPMIEAARIAGADWQLHYGGRSQASMAFLDELVGQDARVQTYPQDCVGLLPLASLLSQPSKDVLVYCCGPEPLLQAVEKFAQQWEVNILHIERFAARPTVASAEAVANYEVWCESSAVRLTVGRHESILDAAERAGLRVLTSCREGTCGTCEVDVVEGLPDHRDSILSPDEQESNETMMICVSGSKTPRLVLRM